MFGAQLRVHTLSAIYNISSTIMSRASGALNARDCSDISAKSLVTPSSKGASVATVHPAMNTQGDPIFPEVLESSAEHGATAAITRRRYRSFFDKSRQGEIARNAYLKTFLSGSFLIIFFIFGIFSIFWGALWKLPTKALSGIVVVSIPLELSFIAFHIN